MEARSISDHVDPGNAGLRFYDVAPREDIPYSGLRYEVEDGEVLVRR